MAKLKIRDTQGNWVEIPAFKGEDGKDGAVQYTPGFGIVISEDNVISCTLDPDLDIAVDSQPTEGSGNPVSSNGVYNALKYKADADSIPKDTGDLTNGAGYITSNDIPNIPGSTGALDNDAGFITNEQEKDPTVPAWAKQPTKPTYTAGEVGALPADTFIPADLSDLTNNDKFIKQGEESDPKFLASAASGILPADIARWNTVNDKVDRTELPDQISSIVGESGYLTKEDLDTTLGGTGYVTFIDACKYPTITGKYDLTLHVGNGYYNPGGHLINANFDQITPEFITELISKELNKIAESGRTLDQTAKVNGEDALIKAANIKLPIPSKLQVSNEIKLYAWGDVSFNGTTNFNNDLIKKYYAQLENVGTASEITFTYSGKHPDGPSMMTMSWLDIDYKNNNGDIICNLSISLSVTYTSDTDIKVTKFNTLSVTPGSIRVKQGAIPRMLSDVYLDTYIEAESTSDGTYDFSGIHSKLRNLLYKKPTKPEGVRLSDLLAASIPIVVINENIYNGANVTTRECLMLQIASVSTADSKVYDTTIEEGVLGGGVDGTYDMKITFADYSRITTKSTTQATLQIRHATLYLNFDDILNTPDEPQYAYKGNFEWYTLSRQQL